MPEDIVLREILCKSALTKTGIPGYQFCINPYVGCSHRCAYCYASFMCRFSGHREGWGQFLDVKINFPLVLDKQLNGRVRREGRVILGSVTDTYQPAEFRYRITRSCLELLSRHPELEVNILTKSALVSRDIPILRELQGCEVGFTITTTDPNAAQVIEPGASLPQQRLEAAGELLDNGIPVWVFIAPLLPGLSDSDESLDQLFKQLKQTGIKEILIDSLNPYPTAVANLKAIYIKNFPDYLPVLEEYLRDPGAYRNIIGNRLRRISRQAGCQFDLI
ncbi:MAG: SPL family radical SAM protein [Chitinophagales bacterium]